MGKNREDCINYKKRANTVKDLKEWLGNFPEDAEIYFRPFGSYYSRLVISLDDKEWHYELNSFLRPYHS